MASNSGSTFFPSTPASVLTQPALALAYRMGKSIWCSSASRSRNSSSTWWTTSSMRASARSTLLTTRTTGRRGFERLAQDEAGLGEGALRGVDEEEHAVDHGQAPFHLTAEVGVPGGVDDVDLDAAPAHGRVLGQDGDALLALEVARVHDTVGELLVGAEGAGLAQHGVDQRRLAVVDVGHDGDVADVLAGSHGGANDRGLGGPPWSQGSRRAGAPQAAERPGVVGPGAEGAGSAVRPVARRTGLARPSARPPRRRGPSVRPTGGASASTAATASGTQGQQRRLGLDPYQVARVGPPADHAAGRRRTAGPARRRPA